MYPKKSIVTVKGYCGVWVLWDTGDESVVYLPIPPTDDYQEQGSVAGAVESWEALGHPRESREGLPTAGCYRGIESKEGRQVT